MIKKLVHQQTKAVPVRSLGSAQPEQAHWEHEPFTDVICKRELTDATMVSLLHSYLLKQQAPAYTKREPDWCDPCSAFFSISTPDIQLPAYVRRLVRYLNSSRSAFVVAIIYLYRIQAEYPVLALTELNVHRLLITALLIATKAIDDRCNSNAFFALVGGIPKVQELNHLELLMLKLLKFSIFVHPEDYAIVVQQLAYCGLPVMRPGFSDYIKARNSEFISDAHKLDLESLLPVEGAALHTACSKSAESESDTREI